MGDLYNELIDKFDEALYDELSGEWEYDKDEVTFCMASFLFICIAGNPTLLRLFPGLSSLKVNFISSFNEDKDPQEKLDDIWDMLNSFPENKWFIKFLNNIGLARISWKVRRYEQVFNVAHRLGWHSATAEEIRTYFDVICHELKEPESEPYFDDRLRETPPKWLSRLMILLLDPQPNDTLYDPECGCGDMLFSVYKEIETFNGDLSAGFYGNDKTSMDHAFAEGLFLLNVNNEGIKYKFGNFTEGDWQSNIPKSFDAVISTKACNPESISSLLNETGRAVICVFEGMLSSKDSEWIKSRKFLVDKDLVQTIITLPRNTYKYELSPETIMVLNKAKSESDKGRIRFIFAVDLYENRPAHYSRYFRIKREFIRYVNDIQLTKLCQAIYSDEKLPAFATTVSRDQIDKITYNLAPDHYIDVSDIASFMGGKYDFNFMRDIAEIYEGNHISNFFNASQTDAVYIRAEDIANYNLSKSTLPKLHDYLTNPQNIQENDILIPVSDEDANVLLCPQKLKGVAIDHSLLIIRLYEKYQHLASYLADFFKSETGAKHLQLTKRQQGYRREISNSVSAMHVPIPEPRVLTVLDSIRAVETRLSTRIESTQALRSELLNVKDSNELDKRLESLSISAKTLDASIIQVEDLNFQMRNFYPFPLVYTYRLLDGIFESSAKYQEQLRVAENLLAFLAALGVSFATFLELLAATTQSALHKNRLLQSWAHGISPGDYHQQIYACAKLMRNNKTWSAINSFAGIWFKGKKTSDFYKNIKSLVQLKNDFKHDRGPKTPDEYEEKIKEVGSLLERCFADLRFLTQYPIYFVTDLDYNDRTQKYNIKALSYIGDHPGMNQVDIPDFPEPLSKGRLYIAIDKEKWISLHPHISVQYCPHCKMRETYYIDWWDGPGKTVELKSFERGHIHREDRVSNQIGVDLEHWLDMQYTQQ